MRWDLGGVSRSLTFGQVGHPVADTERSQVRLQLLNTLFLYLEECAAVFGLLMSCLWQPVFCLSLHSFIWKLEAVLILLRLDISNRGWNWSSQSGRQLRLTPSGLHHPPYWSGWQRTKQTNSSLINKQLLFGVQWPNFLMRESDLVKIQQEDIFLCCNCRTVIFNIFTYIFFFIFFLFRLQQILLQGTWCNISRCSTAELICHIHLCCDCSAAQVLILVVYIRTFKKENVWEEVECVHKMRCLNLILRQ